MGMLSRRSLITSAATLAAASQAGKAIGASSGDLAIVGLQASGVTDPLGAHDATTRLSWRLESTQRNVLQAAYRIQVATSEAGLAAGDFDLWDSGRVNTDRAFDIAYLGRALAARQRAWWRVTVWDNHGRSAMSRAAFWEMGLLSPSDWSAKWIAAETPLHRDDRMAGLHWVKARDTTDGQAFRLSFSLEQAAEVHLIIASNCNSAPAIDGQSLPALAPFDWMPTAVTHVVPLGQGQHTLSLSLGEIVAKPSFLRGGRGCAMLVRAHYPDGQIVRFDGLQAKSSSASGETWRLAGHDDSAWSIVERVSGYMPFASHGGALLRRSFSLAGKVRSARLYVTALGAHETYINGKLVGDGLLAPEWTDFRKRVLYRAHDVTELLADGSNAIGAMVGDGWYGSRILSTGRFSFGDVPLRYLAQLEVSYVDGRTQTVATDGDWLVGASPVTGCDIYGGEDYDARREQSGWAMAKFSAGAGWTRADVSPAPNAGPLEGHISPPIRRKHALKPVKIARVGEAHVVDMGQNFAGWARLRVKGRAGQQVTLKFAEILKKDGSIDQSNLRTAQATDTYVLKGAPQGETYEPRFTYHGFRYVEVTGLAAALRPQDISGVAIHSDVAETGDLRIGNALITQMWRNNLWSQRSNFTGLPTDCPQRDERMAWLGDANVYWDAAAFNMQVDSFTRRWMGDLRNSQTAEGVVPEISPTTWGASGARGATPGWADAAVILPWTVWRRYGDTSIIEQNWEMMKRYLQFIRTNNPELLWKVRRGSDYADWLAFDAKEPGDPTTPKDLVGTAMWKRSADAMADMARATGRVTEAAAYASLSAEIRSAFIKAYVQPDGTVGNDSQTSYILALAFDLAPAEQRKVVAEKLHANVLRRGNHLTTGFLGTPFSLDVLADAGYGSTVYDLLLRTEFPSWGYMVMRGATTTWERWNGDAGDISMNSFNHYALGAINGFVYRRIAGIDPVEPGFRTFRVNPLLDARVRTGGARYQSVSGPIVTAWTARQGGRFDLKLTVPPNTEALVHLPTSDASKVREGGKVVSGHKSITVGPLQDDRLIVKVGSGAYDFSVLA